MTTSAPVHRPALTAIRFPLALWVVLYHVTKPWLVEHDGVARNLLASAPVAVPFFFVLSGFVLTLTYADKLAWRAYLRARVARIVPLYWLGVLLVVPIGLWARARGVVEDAYPLGSLAAVTLGVQAWVPSLALRWNPALWSVSVEMFLYLCVPFLLPLTARVRGRSALFAALACAALAAAPPLLYLVLAPDGVLPGRLDDEATWLFVVRFNPALRLFELGAGVCAARAFLDGVRVPSSVAAGALALLVVALAFGVLPPVFLFGGGTAIVSAVIVLALAGVEQGPLATRLAVALGETSYALYVLHLPVLFWLFAITRRAPTEFSWGFALMACVLSVAIARAAHRLVEEPARRAITRVVLGGRRA